MNIIEKAFFGIIFIFFISILVIISTLKFEILNKSFLFGSFERHNIYSQLPNLLASSLPNDPNIPEDEKISYTDFAKNISPQIIKPLIEDNLKQIIDFANGQSKNIVISIAISGVGFRDTSGIYWSLSELPDKNLQKNIQSMNGLGNVLIFTFGITLLILTGLFFLYGKMFTPKDPLGGRIMLLVSGIFIAAISVFIKIILMIIGKELLNGAEPSQKLLGLLATSLFPEMTTTWLVVGIVLILLWTGLYIKNKSSTFFLRNT
ncbi:MAG: hypothetical protein Q8P26_05635 [Candidatus Levybacteria bacterium]|nr:hypothetical protein [Candidatus Levybacteria bacterium]